MSKFITQIPVEIEALTAHLPANNLFIHSARLSEDRKTVDVVWDHPAFISPVAGEWPFPLANIKSGELPARVKLAEWAKPKAETLKPEAVEAAGVGTNAVAPPGKKSKK